MEQLKHMTLPIAPIILDSRCSCWSSRWWPFSLDVCSSRLWVRPLLIEGKRDGGHGTVGVGGMQSSAHATVNKTRARSRWTKKHQQTADCRLQTVRWRFSSQTSPEILTVLISVLISSIKNPPRQPALIWETGNQHQKRGRERTSSSFTRLEGGGFDDWGWLGMTGDDWGWLEAWGEAKGTGCSVMWVGQCDDPRALGDPIFTVPRSSTSHGIQLTILSLFFLCCKLFADTDKVSWCLILVAVHRDMTFQAFRIFQNFLPRLGLALGILGILLPGTARCWSIQRSQTWRGSHRPTASPLAPNSPPIGRWTNSLCRRALKKDDYVLRWCYIYIYIWLYMSISR